MSGNLLQDFIAEYLASHRKFRFGYDDCTIGLVSAWVESRTGLNLVRSIQYRSKEEGLSIIEARGGWVKAFGDVFTAAKIERIDDPLTGDVGIISHEGDETLAIRLRHLWGVRAIGGFGAINAETLAAWRIP